MGIVDFIGGKNNCKSGQKSLKKHIKFRMKEGSNSAETCMADCKNGHNALQPPQTPIERQNLFLHPLDWDGLMTYVGQRIWKK